MVKLGLLPAIGCEIGVQQVTLTWNDSGRYEDRWVHLAADPQSHCVFTSGLARIQLPVRHGEGKIVAASEAIMTTLIDSHQIPLRYIDPATGETTEKYPQNPNGSPHGIAALTDSTGRLFGMMPHPEAFLHRTNHPRWTREDLEEQGDGLALFQNAVDFIRQGG
jgi:phosphoribosylformylglycinamidine synthase